MMVPARRSNLRCRLVAKKNRFVIRKEWAVEYAEMHDPTNWLKLVVLSFPAMLREMLRAVLKRKSFE